MNNRLSFFRWRPTTTAILFCGFLLVLVALVASFIINNFQPTTSVAIGSGIYNVALADTQQERTKGLSGVEKLSINGGMLFDFQANGEWGIWMKDMKIPIDVIWIDAGKKVVHIEENLDPSLGTTRTFVPKKPSRYVLELPSGSASKAGIRIGTEAKFKLETE